MERIVYPFTAVVGEEKLKKALLLNAVDTKIGGVLIKGPKGVAKSTTARALANLLPDIKVVKGCPFKCDPDNYEAMCDECKAKYSAGKIEVEVRKTPFIDLPVSATLDRVVGTLDIKRAVREGIRALEPGLLGDANRGILYIDEVNLLDDAAVDAILDSAASGVNIVEREGISVSHPARFILVGTMNPEEGDLRPQLRDRFGLSVEAIQPDQIDDLIEISDRVEEFDRNPAAFIKKYSEKEQNLRKNILDARKLLPHVTIGKDLKAFIADVVIKLQAGNRAMIVSVKASKSIAALQRRKEVNIDDVKEALDLTLGHRSKDMNMIRATIEKESRILETKSEASGNGEGEKDSSASAEGNPEHDEGNTNALKENVSMAFDEKGTHSGRAGISDVFRETGSKDGKKIDFHSSFVNMALDGRRRLKYDDLKFIMPRSRASIPVILALDASRSMETQRRIDIARGIARSVLLSAYRIRSKLAYVTFSGTKSELQENFTRNFDLIEKKIMATKAYGKTPLAAALKMMYDLSKGMEGRTVSILITDGRANVPIKGNLQEELIEWSRKLKNVTDLFLVSSTFGSEKFMPSYNELICQNSAGTLVDMPAQGGVLALYSGFRHF
ncbi:MAG: ATP-binding protein [Thermoplasmata archaeon]